LKGEIIMKNFRKIIALLLVTALIAVYPAGASALSIEDGIEPIKEQFVSGEGPDADREGKGRETLC
jgi:hypothetical protein